MKQFLLFFTIVGAAFVVAEAAVVKIELPVETATYKQLPGVDLANAQCLSCHSTEYVSLQPYLPRTYWKDSVDKMITLYGAPVPPEQIEPLVDYLSRAYGAESTNAVATTAALQSKTETGGKIDVETLAKNWGCIACHVDQKIGPAYKDVVAKYKNNPEAMNKVMHQIQNGGVGQWGGNVPMPPFTDLSKSEVTALAVWVLRQ